MRAASGSPPPHTHTHLGGLDLERVQLSAGVKLRGSRPGDDPSCGRRARGLAAALLCMGGPQTGPSPRERGTACSVRRLQAM
jgi:hypothetical protein